jgi:histone deacetylase 6
MSLHSAFALVRPPGHHASCGAARGFCFFNNVAVAAKVAIRDNPHINKVAIFDWDVHYGDGTSEVFYSDPNVLYCSIHRYDNGTFYPVNTQGNFDKIGEGAGTGFNIQFPFNKEPNEDVGDNEYIFAFETVFYPRIRQFDPDLIIISAGFDCAKGDPLGGVQVSPGGFAYMTQRLRTINPRVAVVLEGGYGLESNARSAMAVIRTLLIPPTDNHSIDNLLSQLGSPPLI